jgi:hypothetical protein
MEFIAKREEFLRVERLVKIREQAGVKAPKFVYLDEIENGVL